MVLNIVKENKNVIVSVKKMFLKRLEMAGLLFFG